jgi:hypothetical protein
LSPRALRLSALALALAFAAAPAQAGSVTLQAQFGLAAGFNSDWGHGCDKNAPYVQCADIPGRVIGWSGTQTVKVGGVELLARVVCNSEQIWQGEQFQGTQIILSPAQLPLELTGPCWMEYMANSPTNTAPGGGWEMQLTIFYE